LRALRQRGIGEQGRSTDGEHHMQADFLHRQSEVFQMRTTLFKRSIGSQFMASQLWHPQGSLEWPTRSGIVPIGQRGCRKNVAAEIS
jgi:hypothetical protein